MIDAARRRETFQRLHQSGCFVIPNPWDVGSARYLARLGFPALATTSAGFAWTRGRADNGIAVEDALRHAERAVVLSGGSEPANELLARIRALESGR